MTEYRIGDEEDRPWGHYKVTAATRNPAGEETCEKLLRIDAGRILSLQSHRFRRETWRVLSGSLTVLVETRRWVVQEGEQVTVPAGALHAMANLTLSPCLVHEVQEGRCLEQDIVRYIDPYARQTTPPPSFCPSFPEACALYLDLLRELGLQDFSSSSSAALPGHSQKRRG